MALKFLSNKTENVYASGDSLVKIVSENGRVNAVFMCLDGYWSCTAGLSVLNKNGNWTPFIKTYDSDWQDFENEALALAKLQGMGL